MCRLSTRAADIHPRCGCVGVSTPLIVRGAGFCNTSGMLVRFTNGTTGQTAEVAAEIGQKQLLVVSLLRARALRVMDRDAPQLHCNTLTNPLLQVMDWITTAFIMAIQCHVAAGPLFLSMAVGLWVPWMRWVDRLATFVKTFVLSASASSSFGAWNYMLYNIVFWC